MQRIVLAPAGVPADRLAKLREAFAKLSKDKTYKTLLDKLGKNDNFMNGPAYEKLRVKQDESYATLVQSLTK